MRVVEIFGEQFMDKKQKKGMLLASEVVKLVIALIGITLLVYLLYSLYYTNAHEKDLNEAKATIGRIKDIIQRLEAGKIDSEKVTDINPSGWSFFSFIGSEKKPNSCTGEDCLCICDKVYDNILWLKNRQIKECDQSGVCIVVKNLNKFEPFEIQDTSNGGTNIQISESSKRIEVRKS